MAAIDGPVKSYSEGSSGVNRASKVDPSLAALYGPIGPSMATFSLLITILQQFNKMTITFYPEVPLR